MVLRVDSIAVMLPGCKSKVAGSIPLRGENAKNQPVKMEICEPMVCQLARKSEGLIRQFP